jgi:hypothetical protein
MICGQNEAERLLENMRDLEESVALSLSARRFEVSKLELWLHVLSFAVSNGALITGVFGMNLLSNLEAHPTLFYFVVAGIFCGIVSITALIFLYISSRLKRHARTSAQVSTVSETEADGRRAPVASMSESAQLCGVRVLLPPGTWEHPESSLAAVPRNFREGSYSNH